jgi:hypothetical protein
MFFGRESNADERRDLVMQKPEIAVLSESVRLDVQPVVIDANVQNPRVSRK